MCVCISAEKEGGRNVYLRLGLRFLCKCFELGSCSLTKVDKFLDTVSHSYIRQGDSGTITLLNLHP